MKTPRTDAAKVRITEEHFAVPAAHAEQLECELAAMTALADRLAEALGNLKTEVANTLWTSRDGAEMIPGTAESIREEVNEAIGNAFESSVKALAAYENHKKGNTP